MHCAAEVSGRLSEGEPVAIRHHHLLRQSLRVHHRARSLRGSGGASLQGRKSALFWVPIFGLVNKASTRLTYEEQSIMEGEMKSGTKKMNREKRRKQRGTAEIACGLSRSR
jgi:hypothetical protein